MQSSTSESLSDQAPRTDALGRVLIVVYLVLAIGATMRAIYQVVAKFEEAPLAYLLSLLSGLIYILATVALIKRRGVWRAIAWSTLAIEFLGVIIIGSLSYLLPDLFAHPSVWSNFGAGYLFIPLVLPVLGMLWLWRDGKNVAVHRISEREAGESLFIGDRP